MNSNLVVQEVSKSVGVGKKARQRYELGEGSKSIGCKGDYCDRGGLFT